MHKMGNSLGSDGFRVIRMPPLEPASLEHFDQLPEDPYYKERWREFSQYILFHEHDRWACRRLTHRPFMQAKAYNRKVGGVARHFDPISSVDPTDQFRALADTLELDRNEVYQANLHQWRTRVDDAYRGATIPEGPHRDGHHITSVTCWNRTNIEGGESRLYQFGSDEPFYEYALEPGECLVLRDGDLIHGANDIRTENDAGGFRDIWVVSINPWSERRYGEDFERFAGGDDE